MVHHLPSGTPVVLRPIRPQDKAALADGLARLSPETVYRRFLQPKPRLSAAELRYLTEVDGIDHVALVAELACGPHPRPVVAVGRWVRLADRPHDAEIAVVVGDALQGQGLGTALARALADLARERGITRFTATMLAGNEPARRMLAAITGPASSRVSGGVREFVGELAPAVAPAVPGSASPVPVPASAPVPVPVPVPAPHVPLAA